MDWTELVQNIVKCGKVVLSWTLFAILYPLCFFADTDRSKLRPEIQVSFLFLCRVMILEIGLLVLDIGSDFANGGKFILDGHSFVGGLTIALVFLPGLIRAVTILDLYRQGKLDLSRVGLEEGKYTRTDLVLTLTRVFLARVLFFPILPITMFLKSLFSSCEKDFEKDFQFGITDKFLESFSEAGPQMLLTLTFLLMSPGDFQISKIFLLAIASSTFSVAKTASESHVMLSSTQIPKIRQWLPLLPYFLLTTMTRGFSIALLIAYTGLLYALVPLVILIVCGMALARWVAKMPVGMVVLNSGLSALLSSQHFSTVPLATPKSNLRTLKYLTWNTVMSFIVITLSYITLGFCLEFGVFEYTSETVPFFSCYVNVTTSNAFFCSDNSTEIFLESYVHDVSHKALYKIAIPILIFLWIFCLIYALLIYPGRIFFRETYLVEQEGTNCTCSIVFKKTESNKKERRESRLYEIDLMIENRKDVPKLKKCLSCSHDYTIPKKDSKKEEIEPNTTRPHSFTL